MSLRRELERGLVLLLYCWLCWITLYVFWLKRYRQMERDATYKEHVVIVIVATSYCERVVCKEQRFSLGALSYLWVFCLSDFLLQFASCLLNI